MIRVNLLPRKRDRRTGSFPIHHVILGVLLLAEIIGFFLLYGQLRAQLDEVTDSNRTMQTAITQKKTKLADHDRVKADLANLSAREAAIGQLQSARFGPATMMIEIGHMLTQFRLPTIDLAQLDLVRRESPNALPNDKWDARNLVLTSFKESNRSVTITGLGKSNEDVGEFLRRLSLSAYFANVRLVKTEEKTLTTNDKVAPVVIGFEIKAIVRY